MHRKSVLLPIKGVWYPQVDQNVCLNMVKKDQLCAIVFLNSFVHIYGCEQVRGQDGWILANSQEKKRGQYPAILNVQALSIKDLLYGFRGNFSCGTLWMVSSGQESSILPARVANHSAGFDSSCPLTELGMH